MNLKFTFNLFKRGSSNRIKLLEYRIEPFSVSRNSFRKIDRKKEYVAPSE